MAYKKKPGSRLFDGKRYEFHDVYWTKKVAMSIKANMIKKGYLCRTIPRSDSGYNIYVRKVR